MSNCIQTSDENFGLDVFAEPLQVQSTIDPLVAITCIKGGPKGDMDKKDV